MIVAYMKATFSRVYIQYVYVGEMRERREAGIHLIWKTKKEEIENDFPYIYEDMAIQLVPM